MYIYIYTHVIYIYTVGSIFLRNHVRAKPNANTKKKKKKRKEEKRKKKKRKKKKEIFWLWKKRAAWKGALQAIVF